MYANVITIIVNSKFAYVNQPRIHCLHLHSRSDSLISLRTGNIKPQLYICHIYHIYSTHYNTQRGHMPQEIAKTPKIYNINLDFIHNMYEFQYTIIRVKKAISPHIRFFSYINRPVTVYI